MARNEKYGTFAKGGTGRKLTSYYSKKMKMELSSQQQQFLLFSQILALFEK